MSNLKAQNLKLEKRVAINAGHYFTIHKGFVYICSRYGSNNHIDVVDVRKPRDAKLVHTIKVGNAVSHIEIFGGMLYASERYRALHIFNLARPDAPEMTDVIPLYGDVINGFTVLKDSAVAAFNNSNTAGLIDLKNSFQIQPVQSLKMDGCDSGIVQRNGRLFMCDGKNTLVELGLNKNKLEVVRKFSVNRFKAKKIYPADDRIYLYGDGGKTDTLVLNLKNPEEVIAQFKTGVEPQCILPLEKKDAIILHQDYTCSFLDSESGKLKQLFKFYQEGEGGEYLEVPVVDGEEKFPGGIENRTYIQDATHAVRSGPYLYTVNNIEFMIWKIQKGSVFEKIQDSKGKVLKKKTAPEKK